MKSLKLFLSALLAGMAIGIGGTVYLSVQSSVVGAVLFAVGLSYLVMNAHNPFIYFNV